MYKQLLFLVLFYHLFLSVQLEDLAFLCVFYLIFFLIKIFFNLMRYLFNINL